MIPPANVSAPSRAARPRLNAAAVEAIIDGFDGVGWREISDPTASNRVDSKFIVPAGLVPELLERAGRHYRVVEVEGIRLATYVTRYFDTPDFQLYHAHHSGRTPRYKVRIREYATTGDRYLEVKRKRAAGGRTQKERIHLEDGEASPVQRLLRDDLLAVGHMVDPSQLGARMTTQYQRVTLVSTDVAERVTIDLVLTCQQRDRARTYPAVAIVEVKQTVRSRTPITETLSAMNLHRRSISKYCIGVAALVPDVKTNLFKPVFRYLDRYAGVEPVREVGPLISPAGINGIE